MCYFYSITLCYCIAQGKKLILFVKDVLFLFLTVSGRLQQLHWGFTFLLTYIKIYTVYPIQIISMAYPLTSRSRSFFQYSIDIHWVFNKKYLLTFSKERCDKERRIERAPEWLCGLGLWTGCNCGFCHQLRGVRARFPPSALTLFFIHIFLFGSPHVPLGLHSFRPPRRYDSQT